MEIICFCILKRRKQNKTKQRLININTQGTTKYVNGDLFHRMHNDLSYNTLLTFSGIKWNALAPFLFSGLQDESSILRKPLVSWDGYVTGQAIGSLGLDLNYSKTSVCMCQINGQYAIFKDCSLLFPALVMEYSLSCTL